MKIEELTLLVLGVGGNVSQGILKALHHSRLRCRIIGACINSLSLGLYTVDRAYISPKATDPDFIEWLLTTCRAEGVHAILSGVEPILDVLSKNAELIREQTNARCIVSTPDQLRLSNDKLYTCQWLEAQSINFPRYADMKDSIAVERLVQELGYPLIAKPRDGKSALGLITIGAS